MSSDRALLDAAADERLRTDGYVVIDAPWAPAAAPDLTAAYERLHGWSGTGFEPDLVNEDLDYRERAAKEVGEALDHVVASAFDDHVPFLRNFLCKWPGPGSELYLHRDWMYVDERAGGRTFVVWIPLVDVGHHNGPLQVLPGSHRIDRCLRGTDLNAPWIQQDDVVRSRLRTLEVPLGRAVVLDNGLVHSSLPNHSAEPRLVAAVGVRPASSPLVHFLSTGPGRAARYDVDEAFFLTRTPQGLLQAPPELEVREELDGAQWDPAAPELSAALDAVGSTPVAGPDAARSVAPVVDLDAATDRPTFRRPETQAQLASDGYAVVPVLEADEVEALRAAYRRDRPADDRGLAIDYMRHDRSWMRRVRDLVAPVLAPHVERLFVDHELVFVSFVTKHPGEGSDMFLHEDRTFVDERTERAGTLWIPLVDVGPERPNGGLQLVPGSHRLATTFSGSNTPELFRPFEGPLRDHLVTPTVPAGHAVYYDTRTLHASPANRSDEPREALAVAVVRRRTPLVHVVADGRRRRRLHAVGPDFFLDHHPRELEAQMPAEAVAIAEWDEEPDLPAAAVAHLLGLPAPPVPEVVVPGDLVAARGGAPVASGPPVPSSHRPRRRDLLLRAHDAPPPGVVPTRHTYVVAAGGAGVIALDAEVLRAAAPTGGGIADLVPRAEAAVETDLVLLDPGGRLEVVVGPSRGLDAILDVVDAPRLGAGALVGGRPVQLDPGTALATGAGTRLVLWNEGPGVLAVALSMVPRRAPAATRLGGALLGAVGERRRYDRGRRDQGTRWCRARGPIEAS